MLVRLRKIFRLVVVAQQNFFSVLQLVLKLRNKTKTITVLELRPKLLNLNCEFLDFADIQFGFPNMVLVIFTTQSFRFYTLSASLLNPFQLLFHCANQNDELILEFSIHLVHSFYTVRARKISSPIFCKIKRSSYYHT